MKTEPCQFGPQLKPNHSGLNGCNVLQGYIVQGLFNLYIKKVFLIKKYFCQERPFEQIWDVPFNGLA